MIGAAAQQREDWGALGPAMRALPNNRYRAFVDAYLLEKPGHGAQTNAARRAGFGHAKTKPIHMANIASRLMRRDDVVAAIAEETRKLLRAGAPEAVKALQNLVRDPAHKDHARGISMVLARTDPEISQHDIHVTHKVIDPDQEALEELQALRTLGTPHNKLLELFGPNGLDRLEALEAMETARQAAHAKVIEGKAIETAEESHV
jgi:phage terminase small subunit